MMWSFEFVRRVRTLAMSATLLAATAGFSAQAHAQSWPPMKTDAASAKVLSAFERSPYGKMAKGRVARETLVSGIYALVDPSGKYGPIFIDAKVTRLKNGNSQWIDVASGKQLSTAQARAMRGDMAKRVKVDRAIPFQYGNAKDRVILVSAYDCPYCRQLEQKFDSGSVNATVYLFPLSLQHTRPAPMAVARDIWCSPQAGDAWKATILNQQKPSPSPSGCDKDARDTSMLMTLFDIKGVPVRINPDGRISQM